jgi:hypothetical protein
MDLSVVVPAYNEAESLPELAEWIDRDAPGHQLIMKLSLLTPAVLTIRGMW